jgi:hypothetical protein
MQLGNPPYTVAIEKGAETSSTSRTCAGCVACNATRAHAAEGSTTPVPKTIRCDGAHGFVAYGL